MMAEEHTFIKFYGVIDSFAFLVELLSYCSRQLQELVTLSWPRPGGVVKWRPSGSGDGPAQ